MRNNVASFNSRVCVQMVSVYDSGFMMGDGIWEGLRVYNGELTDVNLDHLNLRRDIEQIQ